MLPVDSNVTQDQIAKSNTVTWSDHKAIETDSDLLHSVNYFKLIFPFQKSESWLCDTGGRGMVVNSIEQDMLIGFHLYLIFICDYITEELFVCFL